MSHLDETIIILGIFSYLLSGIDWRLFILTNVIYIGVGASLHFVSLAQMYKVTILGGELLIILLSLVSGTLQMRFSMHKKQSEKDLKTFLFEQSVLNEVAKYKNDKNSDR